MAIHYKDYYEVLGVPKDASPDAIKRAFRKLAREYHPDVARDKTVAEDRIKEINEAYAVLGDPEKRRKYDELGANWERVGGGAPGGWQEFTWQEEPGGGRGFGFRGTGFSDFFETFFGGGAVGGRDPFAGMGGGSGPRVHYSDFFGQRAATGGPGSGHKGADIEADILVTIHEVMQGSERELSFRIRDPHSGHEEMRRLKVRIPPGVTEGRRLRLSGKGQPGPHGGRPGDLFLNVRLEKHPDFAVEGQDLVFHLALRPWDAALGTHVEIPTLEGPVRLRIRPGTPSEQRQRIPGRGLPDTKGKRGDLFVVTRIEVPPPVSDRQRRLWEELREESGKAV